MSKGLMRHNLELVPKPADALPEHEDELFVRLTLKFPDENELGITMPVSDLLGLLYGMAADVREIVHDDVGESLVFPSNLYNPN